MPASVIPAKDAVKATSTEVKGSLSEQDPLAALSQKDNDLWALPPVIETFELPPSIGSDGDEERNPFAPPASKPSTSLAVSSPAPSASVDAHEPAESTPRSLNRVPVINDPEDLEDERNPFALHELVYGTVDSSEHAPLNG